MKVSLLMVSVVAMATTAFLFSCRHTSAPKPLQKVGPAAAPVAPPTEAAAKAREPSVLENKIAQLRRWVQTGGKTLSPDEAANIVEQWAAQDPLAALEFVATAPRFPQRNGAIAAALAVFCRKDGPGAVNWLSANVADSDDRERIVSAVAQKIMSEAPVAALDLVTATTGMDDAYWFGELLGRVAQVDVQKALTVYGQTAAGEKKRLLSRMLKFWSDKDPLAALDWYLAQPDRSSGAAEVLTLNCVKSGKCGLWDVTARLQLKPEDTGFLLWQLVREGVTVDIAVLARFPPEARKQAMRCMAGNLQESPDRVVALVRSLTDPAEGETALFSGFSDWLNSDRKAAMDWLANLSDGALAASLRERLELRNCRRDPAMLLAKAATITDAKLRRDVTGEAVEMLARTSPGEAANWIMQHPEQAQDLWQVRVVTERFLAKDDAAAMAWVAKLSEGEIRDEALSASARYWAASEIEFATASVAAISNAEKRERCAFNVYRNLAESDAAGAERWLNRVGVSDDVRRTWKILGSGAPIFVD
jgi:hypothetical protein